MAINLKTFLANTGDVSRVATPQLLAVKSSADNELLVIEVDPVTGALPVSGSIVLTPSPILIDRNGTDTEVAFDTATPANNRPLPVTVLAGDSLAPLSVGSGANTATTLRTSANIALSGTNVSAANPVPVSPGTGAIFNVSVQGDPSTETTLLQVSTRVNNVNSSVQALLTDTQLRAAPVPVSAVSLPLPSGASTGALQASGNASLTSIDGKVATETTLAAINTKTATLISGRVPVNSEITKTNFGVPVHDAINVDVSGGALDVYTFRTGGVAGTIVATITINYTDATKATILSVVRT